MNYIDLDATDTAAEIPATEILPTLDGKPCPLQILLTLYTRGKGEDLYIGYYQGFKRLHEWLKPIAIPPLPVGVPVLPHYLNNWETQELSIIVGCTQDDIWHTFLRIYHGLPVTQGD